MASGGGSGTSGGGNKFKIMLSGDANVGKTSLLERFAEGAFTEDYIPPAQDPSKTKVVTHNGAKVKVEVFDTCGQERFRILTGTYYNQCNGILLVFDLTNPSTLERIPTWLKQAEHYTTPGIPKVLIGNKCDLKAEVKVSKEEIQTLCASSNVKYFETSAKQNIGVEEAFLHLVSLGNPGQGASNNPRASGKFDVPVAKEKKEKKGQVVIT